MRLRRKTITYKRILDRRFIQDTPNNFIENFINGRKHFYSSSGRSGMLLLIDMLAIKPGEEVLLPAFSPEGLILPFKKKEIRRKYYSLDENLNPDISDIERIIKESDIKLIVVIHYFGLKNNIEGVQNINKKDIPLLEDCAHAFLSKDKMGIYLGMSGDIAFFSFPKFLPVPDGGLFIFNKSTLYSDKPSIHRPGLLMKLAWISGLTSLIFNTIHIKNLWAKPLQIFSVIFYAFHYKLICSLNKPYRISKYSLLSLKRFAYEVIIRRRESNVAYYNSKFDGIQLDTNLPGYFLKESDRKNLQKRLRNKQIESLTYYKRWFYYEKPLNASNAYKPSIILEHLLLPVNEYLNSGDLQRVTETVCKYLNK